MAVSIDESIQPEVEEVEHELLLLSILKKYGYDFRDYSPASLRRRIRLVVRKEGVASASELQGRLLRDPGCMVRFIDALTVPVTSMFRDAPFYRAMREEVIPFLRTYPFVRIWHAGCATGEEVYSLAILLEEEGIYERCRIYATDLSDGTLQRAVTGIYDLARMRDYTQAYQQAGGLRDFSSYYTADADRVRLRSRLRRNIVFSRHNLVSDGVFNEFHLVLCRNVMIYFNHSLRSRVQRLLSDSLCRFGVLGLGLKEVLDRGEVASEFRELSSGVRLYRKEV